LWNDQNEQETEALAELPSRLVQRQVYEGYFVGLRRLLEGLFCKIAFNAFETRRKHHTLMR
jgi:hypothetical protein